MTFCSALTPRMRLCCWKTKPKVRRRNSARNFSGSEETASPRSRTRPDVGRARQPMSVSSVVLPDPLGPFSTVTSRALIVRLTPRMAATSFARP